MGGGRRNKNEQKKRKPEREGRGSEMSVVTITTTTVVVATATMGIASSLGAIGTSILISALIGKELGSSYEDPKPSVEDTINFWLDNPPQEIAGKKVLWVGGTRSEKIEFILLQNPKNQIVSRILIRVPETEEINKVYSKERLKALTGSLTVAIFPMLMIFALIVAVKVMEVLST